MNLNILIVDDSITIRAVMEKTLQMAGVQTNQVLHASNGQEALDILAQEWVDLIFADINMPVMNGVEMIKKMSEDGLLKTIPVVVVSTEGSKTRIDELKDIGITAYIRKPFQPEDFKAVVEQLIGRSNAA
ncbi:response regulator [bacterium AH-315-I18]|nr:response regulator [Phycisphaeraceae bacterium]MBN4061187.1 response regulator [bacterium AH-315-I18]